MLFTPEIHTRIHQLHEQAIQEIKNKILPNKWRDDFLLPATDQNQHPYRVYMSPVRNWFLPRWQNDPETHVNHAMTELLRGIGIQRSQAGNERHLHGTNREGQPSNRKVDIELQKGHPAGFNLLIELEPFGSELTASHHGIDQVKEWFTQNPSIMLDCHGLATNLVDWIYYYPDMTNNQFITKYLSFEEAMELCYRVHFGLITQDNFAMHQQYNDQITREFFTEFNRQLRLIIQNHAPFQVSGIETLPNAKRQDILIGFYRTIFFRMMFLRILYEWNLLRMNPIQEIIEHYYTFAPQLFNTLFFDVFNKPIEQRDALHRFQGDDQALPLYQRLQEMPYLNGGLFRPTEIEQTYPTLALSPSGYKEIYQFLFGNTYTFLKTKLERADQKYVNPDVLGYIFEQTLDATGNRQSSGTYYTPITITQYIARSTLEQYLTQSLRSFLEQNHPLIAERLSPTETIQEWNFQIFDAHTQVQVYAHLLQLLKEFRVCDNACGSGAFLRAMGDEMISWYYRIYNLNAWQLPYKQNGQSLPNDPRPFPDLYAIRRYILQHNLFGVDINATAIDICHLRLWLWMVEPFSESDVTNTIHLDPLPNIDFNFMQGNSILGFTKYPASTFQGRLQYFSDGRLTDGETIGSKRQRKQELLRQYYAYSGNNEQLRTQLVALNKEILGQLDIAYYDIALRNPEDLSLPAMQKLTPFHWCYHFEHVLEQGGFHAIIGNPPYIKEGTNRSAFDGVRHLSYYQGKMDIWYLFACIGVDLLHDNGLLSYIAQSNWITSFGAKKLRKKLFNHMVMLEWIDFTDQKIFQAGIQTMIAQLHKTTPVYPYSFPCRVLTDHNIPLHDIYTFLFQHDDTHGSEYVTTLDLQPDTQSEYDGKPVQFLNEDHALILQTMQSNAEYLTANETIGGADPHQYNITKQHQAILGDAFRIGQGIFVLSDAEYNALTFTPLEKRDIIRKFYTTDQLFRYYGNAQNNQWLLCTPSDINPRIDQYPNVKRHITPFIPIITSDNKPYGIHRTRDARFFSGERIFSVRKTFKPTFSYFDNENGYVGGICYVIKSQRWSMKALTGLLNSKVIHYWLEKKGKKQGSMLQIDAEPLYTMPIPQRIPVIFEQLTDMICWANYCRMDNILFLEQLIDLCAYELYFKSYWQSTIPESYYAQHSIIDLLTQLIQNFQIQTWTMNVPITEELQLTCQTIIRLFMSEVRTNVDFQQWDRSIIQDQWIQRILQTVGSN